VSSTTEGEKRDKQKAGESMSMVAGPEKRGSWISKKLLGGLAPDTRVHIRMGGDSTSVDKGSPREARRINYGERGGREDTTQH